MLKSIISFLLLYWISYLLWIYSQISSKSSNVVFSIIILENLRKSLWRMRNQNNEKIETNNWRRLLIFDDKINFYFLIMFLFMTSVVYCRTFLHFMSLFNNLKKLILKTYPSTPKVGVFNVEFALKLRICRSLSVSNESERSFPQHCILSSTTSYIAGHSL